ncbi:hypothetical protein [Thauera sp. Sel9]|uniref:hypothetical protein n=1 Tax=Thauera sp. Sel9 TaxID=2974299 RepID=UPI0021E1762A|nr:hypothetical protein [Thauera sp. Sel9]MCV2217326.1 hypothetical protein [Thauera sp. Sel9]
MARDPVFEQTRLLAGVLTHVSRYLDTGCPRAAHQAGLLLRCLDASTMDEDLMTSCEQLDQAISHPRHLGGASAGSDAWTSDQFRSRTSATTISSFQN